MNFVTSKRIRKILEKYPCQFLVLLGMRSNGKSTAVKKLALEDAWNKDELFFYVRRQGLDMKNYLVESYFKSVDGFDISEITHGQADGVICKEGKIFLYKEDCGEKTIVKHVGYFGALSISTRWKSLNFPEVTNVIFEEFCTDGLYIDDEVNLLMQLVSTIARLRSIHVFMIANTITDINPYFRYFELSEVFKQKPDTIDVYHNEDTTIDVFMTAQLENKEHESRKMYFGDFGKMIKNGDWQRDRKRQLENPRKEYECIYSMVLNFQSKLFLMEFLEHSKNNIVDGHIWFISPKNTKIKRNTRVISDVDIESDYTTIGFVPLSKNEVKLFSFLTTGKIAYSDNLTGTQFLQAFSQMKRDL